MWEGHTGKRRRPFGAATINGFLKFLFNCLLNRWKYCAGVVGNTICILTLSLSEEEYRSVVGNKWRSLVS